MTLWVVVLILLIFLILWSSSFIILFWLEISSQLEWVNVKFTFRFAITKEWKTFFIGRHSVGLTGKFLVKHFVMLNKFQGYNNSTIWVKLSNCDAQELRLKILDFIFKILNSGFQIQELMYLMAKNYWHLKCYYYLTDWNQLVNLTILKSCTKSWCLMPRHFADAKPKVNKID